VIGKDCFYVGRHNKLQEVWWRRVEQERIVSELFLRKILLTSKSLFCISKKLRGRLLVKI
jgi:hypothetical protein